MKTAALIVLSAGLVLPLGALHLGAAVVKGATGLALDAVARAFGASSP